jgi:type IV secretory pathway VirD2 relaxase
MTGSDDDFHIKFGRPRDSARAGARRIKSFVGQVTAAAKKAGHVGKGWGPSRGGGPRAGRGAGAALARARHKMQRRVLVKARVIRHQGTRFRAAPLSRHIAYLERDGVTRDGGAGRLFDAAGEDVDRDAFAARCEDDRHHFRFIMSPEDANEMQDLRAYTRELMNDASRDLGTRLDWVAIDHWNTDNPHIHVLVRGRAGDGADLLIDRDYIREGLRNRAQDRVTLELGPRSEQEVHRTLAKEVEAERWTSLDRRLRHVGDRNAGMIDLRPFMNDAAQPERQLLIGRAQALERLGLATPVGPAVWTLLPDAESTLRALAVRGDIIKTMHAALTRDGGQPDVSRFAIHDQDGESPIVGRLVERGHQDELTGSAYAVVDGIDGRTHHLKFRDLETTGDARPGAIVELRTWEDDQGRAHRVLTTRSDLNVNDQVTARGATWLDRQLTAPGPAVLGGGFGRNVETAMKARADHLVQEGLAAREGRRIVFARNLLQTLQRRELDDTAEKMAMETGLAHRPSQTGEPVSGIYRRRVMLASGRFAMIDDGMSFQLVPWRPSLEHRMGREVLGTMAPGGGVNWSFSRSRGLGL